MNTNQNISLKLNKKLHISIYQETEKTIEFQR